MKSPKQSIKVLSTLALAASDTREDTLTSIILNTVYEKEAKKDNILEEIKSLYHFEPHKSEVYSLLSKMIDANLILIDKEGKCTLSVEERLRLQNLDQEIKEQDSKRFQNFKLFITDTLEKNIDITQIKRLYNVFIEYLYHSFYEFGEDAIHNFVPDSNKSNLDNEDFIQEAFTKLNDVDGSLKAIFKLVIDKFPDNVSREDLTFLNDISLKTQSFVSLGLKPEDAESMNDFNIIDWILYLDTNVLYSLLDLHAHPENQSCKALIQLINDNADILKIKLRYSEQTIKELTKKKKDFALLDDKLSSKAITGMLNTDKLDDFSRQFYTSLLNNKSTTLHPSKIIDLSDITLKNDKIEISQNSQMIESLGESFLNARTQDYLRFVSEKNDNRMEYAKTKHITLPSLYRSDKQAYHDISLRESILKYRVLVGKKETHLTFNSLKYFAITLDDLLIQFDQYVRRNNTGESKFPVFFKPAFLLSKLVKILPIKTEDYKKAYFKAVTSRGFNKDIRKSDDIQKVVSYLRSKGIDDDKLIYDLISQDLFLEKYRENSNKNDSSDLVFVEDEINKIFKDKSDLLEKNINELARAKDIALVKSEENQDLVEKVAELTQQVQVFSRATKTLNKKIDKLETTGVSNNKSQIGINFEAEEKNVEIARLKKATNKIKQTQREDYIDVTVKDWKRKTNYEFYGSILLAFIGLVIFLIVTECKLYKIQTMYEDCKGNIITATILFLAGSIFTAFTYRKWYDKHYNHSNIENYKKGLKIPPDLNDIE